MKLTQSNNISERPTPAQPTPKPQKGEVDDFTKLSIKPIEARMANEENSSTIIKRNCTSSNEWIYESMAVE